MPAKSLCLVALGTLLLLSDGALRRAPDDPVAALLARVPQAAQALSFSGQGFPAEAAAWGQSDTAPAADQPPARALSVRLPEASSGTFLVGAKGRKAPVSIQLPAAKPAALQLQAGRGVYRSVFEGVDMIAVRDPEYFELAFVVNDPERAPRLSFTAGGGAAGERVSIEKESGAALLRTAGGSPLLRIDPPVALDAAGARRDGRYELAGSELSIALNLSGLTPPIVVDPRFTIPFWTLLSDDRAPGAVSYSKVSGSREIRVVFDEARGKPVLIRPVRSQQREDSTTAYAELGYQQTSERKLSPLLRVAPDGSVTTGAAEITDWQRTFYAQSETWEWNGVGWAQLPLTGLRGLIDPAVAYDRGRQRLLVATGANPGLLCRDESFVAGLAGRTRCTLSQPDVLFELGPQGWRGLSLAGAPPPRVRAALAPFPPFQVLFGGRALEAPPGFALIDPYGPPYPENLARGLLNDTWRYDGERWEHVPTSNPPPARENAQLVFDERRHRLVLIGGAEAGFDLWEFDGSDWLQRIASNDATLPPSLWGRKQVLAVWNPVRQTTLLFGGLAPKLPSCALDDATVTAQMRNPLKLEELSAAGCLGGYVHDSWEWDGQSLRQLTQTAYSGRVRGIPVFRQLQGQPGWFVPGTAAPPEATRSGPRPLLPWRYDPDPNHFRLRSTLERAHATDDLPPARTSVPAGAPAPLSSPPAGPPSFVSPLFASDAQPDMVFDPIRGQALIVSPEDARVFETNGAVWSERTPSRTPFDTGMQDFFAATWDSAQQQIILFDPRTAATWTHSDAAGWSRLAPTVSPPVWAVDPEIRRERDLSNSTRAGDDNRFAAVARQVPQMAFDRGRARTVMLYSGALWEFDGSTWLQYPAPAGWETCQSATLLAFDGLRSRVVAVGCKLPGTTMEWDGAWHGPFPGPYTDMMTRTEAIYHTNGDNIYSNTWRGTVQLSWQHPNALFESSLLGGVGLIGIGGELMTWDGTTWKTGPHDNSLVQSDWFADLDNLFFVDMNPPDNIHSYGDQRDFVPLTLFPPIVEDAPNHRLLLFRDGENALRELRLDVPVPRWGQVKAGDRFSDGTRVYPHPFELLSAEHVTQETLTDPASIVLLQYNRPEHRFVIENRTLVLPREKLRVPEKRVNNLFWPFRVLRDPVSNRIRVLTHRGAVWELGAELRTGPGDPCTSTSDCSEGFCSPEGLCCDTPCDVACVSCGGNHPGHCDYVPTGAPDPNGRCGAGPCAGVCSAPSITRVGTCVYDAAHTCGPGQLGQACTTGRDCALGYCSPEGVCCDTACDGACVTCTGSQPGHCAAVPAGAPDPFDRCGSGECAGVCSGPSTQPSALPRCNYDDDRGCGPEASCANGILTPGGHCAPDAATCVATDLTPAPCAGNVACRDDTSCKQSCASRTDCNGAFAECNTTTHSCEPDAVSVAASARGVQPSEWVPQVRRTPEQQAEFLRQHGFASDAQGRVLFNEIAMAGVVPAFNPDLKTPATGFEYCIERIQTCGAATQSLDACVAANPRCASTNPWQDDPSGFDCCPSECLLQYFDLRDSYEPGRALIELIHSLCYPGLQTYLEGLQ